MVGRWLGQEDLGGEAGAWGKCTEMWDRISSPYTQVKNNV